MRPDTKQYGKRDLPRIEAHLASFGLHPLAIKILANRLDEPEVLNFGSLPTAKIVRATLYDWLWFHPDVKSRISLRLNEGTGELTILPKAAPEKRGRRGSK